MTTLTQEVIPFYLTKMNVVAKENGGHLVLNRVNLLNTPSKLLIINFLPDHMG
jgi:hypothetical protein